MAGTRNLDTAAIVAAAADLVEETSYDGLTLAALAARLGVKSPSLYNHVEGIEDVRRRLAAQVGERMRDAIRGAAVGRSQDEALRTIAHEYRHFAAVHPQLYRIFLGGRRRGDDQPLDVVRTTLHQILAAYQLRPGVEADFIRSFHSAMYGFIALEAAGAFTAENVDASYDVLVEGQIVVLHWLAGRAA